MPKNDFKSQLEIITKKLMEDITACIQKMLDNRLAQFIDYTSNKTGVDRKVLMDCWIQSQAIENKTTKTKKSHYQIFFSAKRLQLKEEQPSISFGDLSKQISKMWNSMNKEEQLQWVQHQSTPKADYAAMKMSELKTLCEKRGLKKTGNKTELVNILTGKTDEKKIKLSDAFDDIHICESSGERRVTIEDGDEILDDEEFVFEDEDDEDQSISSGEEDDFEDEV